MPLEPERRQGPDRRRVTRGGRRQQDIGIRNPDACPEHGRTNSIVTDTVHHRGFIGRRHRCLVCNARWDSYQTIIDPTRITVRVRVARTT